MGPIQNTIDISCSKVTIKLRFDYFQEVISFMLKRHVISKQEDYETTPPLKWGSRLVVIYYKQECIPVGCVPPAH